jgi:hypothetical protein
MDFPTFRKSEKRIDSIFPTKIYGSFFISLECRSGLITS